MASFLLLLSSLATIISYASAKPSYVMRYKDTVETICLGSTPPDVSTAAFTNSPSDAGSLNGDFDASGPQYLYIGSKANFQGKHQCANDISYYMYDPASSSFTSLSYSSLPQSVKSSSLVVSIASASDTTVPLTVLNSYPTDLTVYGIAQQLTVDNSTPVTTNVQMVGNNVVSDAVGAFSAKVALYDKSSSMKAAIILIAGSTANNNGFWTVKYVMYRTKNANSKSCQGISASTPSYSVDVSSSPKNCIDAAYSATAIMAADMPVSGLATRKRSQLKPKSNSRKLLQSRDLKCYCSGTDGVSSGCSYFCYYSGGRCYCQCR